MNTNRNLQRVINSVFPVLFNTVFFVLGGFEHCASVWISYGFIHFAYVMLLLTPHMIPDSRHSNAALGYTLYGISAFYFLAEFLCGTVFILLPWNIYKTAFLLQLCLAGFYAVILITNIIANNHTAEAESQRAERSRTEPFE